MMNSTARISTARHSRPACPPAAPVLRSKPVKTYTSRSSRRCRDCRVQVATPEAPTAADASSSAAAADTPVASTSSSSGIVSHHVAAPTAAGSASGSCPFLAALPSPPPAQHNWWTRLQQLSDPPGWQPTALGPHRVVEASAELGIPGQILVGDADLARAVLAGEGDSTRQGNFLKGFARLIGSQSLLSVQEPHHKYLRALIMPAFEKPAIESLVPRMERVLTKYLERWCEQTADGSTVQASDECKTMTFDFIINSIMGRDFSDEELAELIEVYKVWSAGILAFPYINLPFTKFGRAVQARQTLLAKLQADIDRARAELASGQQPAGILGSLVVATDEEGNRLTDEQVQDNLLLLLLAGHDTSAVTVTNMLAQLQQHPAALQRLREEQQRVVARHGTPLSGAALREMEYADAVIRETLRVLPVVPSLARQAARDFELGGYQIKEGQYLTSLLTHVASTDPRWSPEDSQQFRPERMLTPEGQKPGALLPFGHGPRFCAGYAVAMAEMKAFLALMARGYGFSADTNTRWVQAIGRVPANGLPMTVHRL